MKKTFDGNPMILVLGFVLNSVILGYVGFMCHRGLALTVTATLIPSFAAVLYAITLIWSGGMAKSHRIKTLENFLGVCEFFACGSAFPLF
jgi:hypothetical protein